LTLGELDTKLRTEAYTHYKNWSKDRRLPYISKPFCGQRFGRGQKHLSYAELGSMHKGSHVKQMTYWVASFTLEESAAGSMGELRAVCSYCLAFYQSILARSPEWPGKKIIAQAFRAGRNFLLSYQKLALWALSQRRALYKIMPKHHQFLHLLLNMFLTGRNPRCCA
jgi:hypothetical protein